MSATDELVGLIPVIVTAGVTMKIAEKSFGRSTNYPSIKRMRLI